ncbi:MAG: hypothetical protein ACXVWX_10050 [Nocardioides sp.]
MARRFSVIGAAVAAALAAGIGFAAYDGDLPLPGSPYETFTAGWQRPCVLNDDGTVSTTIRFEGYATRPVRQRIHVEVVTRGRSVDEQRDIGGDTQRVRVTGAFAEHVHFRIAADVEGLTQHITCTLSL